MTGEAANGVVTGVPSDLRDDRSSVRVRLVPPEGLRRVTRLGHALLETPVRIVLATRDGARTLVATPSDVPPVPHVVAQRLSTATSAMTVEAPDGTTWFGAAVGPWRRGGRVSICTTKVLDGGRTRATLNDLAALAAEVLRRDVVEDEADGLRELLGTASHDLRNPLSVLRAGLETLALHPDALPDGQTERIADLAVRQARRMTGMIDGLLSLHGLEDDGRHEEFDLRVLARDAVEAGRLCHDLVDLRLQGELPSKPVVVRGVPDSLARVLTNLVSNAAVHGGDRVWVGLGVDEGEATVTVADDGPGMPADSALDTGRRASRSGGHGLGLVIAQRIVDAHHGRIGYSDRPGGGTVVELTLPLVP